MAASSTTAVTLFAIISILDSSRIMMAPSSAETVVTLKPWGTLAGKRIELLTMKNSKGQEVELLNYGATIRGIRTPDKNGTFDDVVLGFDNIEGYVASRDMCFGSTIGRVANRIRDGRFTLDGVDYHTGKNGGNFTIHGGFEGWGSRVWSAEIVDGAVVVMTLESPDGDEGFPGRASVTATFTLGEDGTLTLEMRVNVTKACPINLTNHVYLNIAGHGKNSSELLEQHVQINADRWTETDDMNIPTGVLCSVGETTMDLRNSTLLSDIIDGSPDSGFDNNFCLPDSSVASAASAASEAPEELRFVARVSHPASGRYLEVRSNQPGVQFYTAQNLPGENTEGLLGKDGQRYFRHGSLCLETQNYPDAVNHDNFPNSIFGPDRQYHHVVAYKFGVEADR